MSLVKCSDKHNFIFSTFYYPFLKPQCASLLFNIKKNKWNKVGHVLCTSHVARGSSLNEKICFITIASSLLFLPRSLHRYRSDGTKKEPLKISSMVNPLSTFQWSNIHQITLFPSSSPALLVDLILFIWSFIRMIYAWALGQSSVG